MHRRRILIPILSFLLGASALLAHRVRGDLARRRRSGHGHHGRPRPPPSPTIVHHGGLRTTGTTEEAPAADDTTTTTEPDDTTPTTGGDFGDATRDALIAGFTSIGLTEEQAHVPRPTATSTWASPFPTRQPDMTKLFDVLEECNISLTDLSGAAGN